MKNIIFIAPPAAGKGTQAKLLADKYNIPHISTGDLLRNEISNNTEIGLNIKNIIEQGKLVEDNIIINLLKERIIKEDCNNGYILDGFPRTLEQAISYNNLLNSLNKDLGVVIFLDIDKKLALERTLGRLICPSCGRSYNKLINDLKPKNDNLCDKCNIELKTRSDDNEETFINRFDTYLDKTENLINYYKESGNLKVVKVLDGVSALDINKEIQEIVNE